MSHEIRTPMNVILSIIEMQLEKDLPNDTLEALDKVQNSGYLLLNIINDILDISKIESGKMELTLVKYDVASLINDTVQLNLMRFANKPIQFVLTVDEHIPAKLFGDDLRIKQILNNLLSNAFKYTDSGQVSLSISLGAAPGNNLTIIFNISDTGRGMSKDQVARLFDDYSRFNMEANRQIEGTGLGLSITKNFIDIMNGKLEVESEPDKGTTFTLRLPQGYVSPAVLGKDVARDLQLLKLDNKIKQKKLPQFHREYMPYGKILVVDDMEPNLYVAKGLFAPYGLSIDTALSGKEAIDKIKDGREFDIIFMDHFMPEMDGIEATKIIRGLGYKKPIIALTANALVGQEEIFLAKGFNGFLSKPIDTRQINSTLNRLIRDKYPTETIDAARKLQKKLEKGEDEGPPDLSALKALVVDDFLPNLNAAAGMLHKYRMQADCASSGQEAIDRIKRMEPRYNIIFMDHLMPEMDGIETVKYIREKIDTDYAKRLPIVALTANFSISRMVFFENGFNDCIFKPIDKFELDKILIKYIHSKQSAETLEAVEKQKTNLENEEQLDTATNEFILPYLKKANIKGLNISAALDNFGGSAKTYIDVLASFVNNVHPLTQKLCAVKKEMLQEYAILIHGVKGSCYGIGAAECGDLAKELETLAKKGDFEQIRRKNNHFVKEIESLSDGINKLLEDTENAKKQFDSRELLEEPNEELLRALVAATGNYETDKMNEIIDELDRYRYKKRNDVIVFIKEKATNFAYDEIEKKLISLLLE